MKEKENTMTFETFLENLPHLDWFYNMSDDHQAYLRGAAQVRSYRELAESKGPEWVEAFEAEDWKHTIS